MDLAPTTMRPEKAVTRPEKASFLGGYARPAAPRPGIAGEAG